MTVVRAGASLKHSEVKSLKLPETFGQMITPKGS